MNKKTVSLSISALKQLFMMSLLLSRRIVFAVAFSLNCGCVKLLLPNSHVVDVLTPVLDEISKWLQTDPNSPESGGYIAGYEHKTTNNIVLGNL